MSVFFNYLRAFGALFILPKKFAQGWRSLIFSINLVGGSYNRATFTNCRSEIFVSAILHASWCLFRLKVLTLKLYYILFFTNVLIFIFEIIIGEKPERTCHAGLFLLSSKSLILYTTANTSIFNLGTTWLHIFSDTIDKIVLLKVNVVRLCNTSSGQKYADYNY